MAFARASPRLGDRGAVRRRVAWRNWKAALARRGLVPEIISCLASGQRPPALSASRRGHGVFVVLAEWQLHRGLAIRLYVVLAGPNPTPAHRSAKRIGGAPREPSRFVALVPR